MTAPARILAINFRDPGHPEAGGAELHLEHVLLEAVRRGIAVTWLASGFPGGAADTEHRGMRVMRRGSWWDFQFRVPAVLGRECSNPPPDLVIEDINKVPCFSPWWTRAPVAGIVPHLFGTTAFREAHPVMAAYVVAMEAMIPAVYRGSRFVVISESTRDDLVRRGLDGGRITVVHCGVDHERYRPDPAVAKSPRPTILYVGRLRRYKGVDWVFRALPRLLGRVPEARLQVVGDGPFAGELKLAAARTGVAGSVEFLGFLPAAEKVRRMREAWCVVQPSPKEGWGLTVVEAGACGTAVVAADSPGLRDSVKDGLNGLLVRYDDTRALADTMARVLRERELRERLERGGLEWAQRFQWSECGRRSLDALLAGVAR
ncbi:MAG TPA: glycosyltransferase family 4 protein [Dongiaceae bacterium]|nr:glycosyltransferase family 4 protein [Dongiaceae bacterium]